MTDQTCHGASKSSHPSKSSNLHMRGAMNFKLEPGKTLTLTYPDSTLVESLSRLERRHIQVIRIRDLLAQPLSPAEYLRRPFIRRSRWLIFGYDERIKEYRQFYLGSSLEHEAPGILKVALYEPAGNRPAYAVSRAFGPRRRDRRLLAKAICQWTKEDMDDLQLRIYADDLKKIS